MQFDGLLYVLATTPLWVTVGVAYFITMGGVWFLRDRYEGFFYNVAASSQLGEGLGAVIAFMAITLLQQTTATVPAFLNDVWWQLCIYAAAEGVGIAWCYLDPPAKPADTYHHLIIAPLLIFMMVVTLCVLWLNGTEWHWMLLLAAVGLWGGLFLYDVSARRLNQRQWLRKKGINPR